MRHVLPFRGEELRIQMERALSGRGGRDRETNYILTARAHGLTWGQLMDTPYRILLKMNLLKAVEAMPGSGR